MVGALVCYCFRFAVLAITFCFMIVLLNLCTCIACEFPSYLDRQSNSCVRQCPLFFFENHTGGLCQPCKLHTRSGNDCIHVTFSFAVPDMYSIHADATAYFGRIVTNSTPGTETFRFRIVIDLSRFNNDLLSIITLLHRNNLVQSIFRFSNGRDGRTFTFSDGIVAVNASGMLQPEFRLLANRLVLFEDSVIYYQTPPPSLGLPATLDFDLSILAVSLDTSLSESVRFAVGTVNLFPPPGEYGH